MRACRSVASCSTRSCHRRSTWCVRRWASCCVSGGECLYSASCPTSHTSAVRPALISADAVTRTLAIVIALAVAVARILDLDRARRPPSTRVVPPAHAASAVCGPSLQRASWLKLAAPGPVVRAPPPRRARAVVPRLAGRRHCEISRARALTLTLTLTGRADAARSRGREPSPSPSPSPSP